MKYFIDRDSNIKISDYTSCYLSVYKQQYRDREAGCFSFSFGVLICCQTKYSRGKKDVSEVDITKTVYMNCDDA